MRRFVLLFVTFVFSLDVMAVPSMTATQSRVLEFIQQSQLSKRSRNFNELIREINGLDPEQKTLLKEISSRLPGAVIPKIEVQMIKNDRGGQDMQLQMVGGGQSATITVSEENDLTWIRATGSQNKKPKTIKFASNESNANLRAMMQGLMADEGFAGKKAPRKKFQMLKAAEVERLSRGEKREYFRMLQGFYVAIEEVQAATKAGKKTSSIWDRILDPAYAAGGGDCMTAGYATTFGADGVCGSDDPALSDAEHRRSTDGGVSEIRCNPDIFGSGAAWVPAPTEGASNPKKCLTQHPDALDAFPATIKNKDEFDKASDKAQKAALAAADACDAMKSSGKSNSVVAKACMAMRGRYTEIISYDCITLQKKHKDRFPQLDCSGSAVSDVPVPENPPVVDDGGYCKDAGLPKDKLTCPEACRKPASQCPNNYHCECAPPESEPIANGPYVSACGPPVKADAPAPAPVPKAEEKKTNWMPFLLIGGAALLILGLIFAFKKKTKTVTVPGPTVYVPGPKVYIPGPPVPGPPSPPIYIPFTPPTHPGVQ